MSRPLTTALVLTILANLILLLPGPLALQVLAVLFLTILVPGALLVRLLIGPSEALHELLEHGVYAVAVGVGILVVALLWLSYIPGPLTRAMALTGFDTLILGLWVACWRSEARAQQASRSSLEWDGDLGRIRREAHRVGRFPGLRLPSLAQRKSVKAFQKPSQRSASFRVRTLTTSERWLLIGAMALLLIASPFRLVHLGYSEFYSDEARAVLRATGVIQGYDDVLFIHRKGPVEILIPTAIYVLTGYLTEAYARLPFAIANITGVIAVFLLGRRMFSPIAGWLAALLLAFDGYLIAFARFVEYQSIVFLTSTAVLLSLYRLYCSSQASPTRLFTLAAWLLTAGLLSHYEAALVLFPAFFLLAAICRHRSSPISPSSAALPLLVVALPLASFYIPFVVHPNFQATWTYITARRIGDELLYNNVADFFQRTALYSGVFVIGLMALLSLIGLALLYRRSLSGPGGWLLTGAATLVLLLTAWNSRWMRFSDTDWLIVPWALLLTVAWLLPRTSIEHRTVLLWWGLPMLIALFLVAKPRTHVYVFFPGWMLLAGWTLSQGWNWLRNQASVRITYAVGTLSVAAMAVISGYYAYLLFLRSTPETVLTYEQNLPMSYYPFRELPEGELYGFPLNNGWKVIGMLYRRGEIQGDYDVNEDPWVPSWYTRGQNRCGRTATWYFLMKHLKPDEAIRTLPESYRQRGFQLWGMVEVNGIPKLEVYRQTDGPIEPRKWRLEEWEAAFDRGTTPEFPLDDPIVIPPIEHPLHINLDGKLWLEGYDLEPDSSLRPGDTLRLRLYWRAQWPLSESYTVFNQLRSEAGEIVGQLDGIPVCGRRPTYKWDPGEFITDTYVIEIKPDALPGTYTLYTGMYLPETGERLTIVDEAGHPMSNEIELAQIHIR
ncbi:MAG: glycosyltransferase family 39 protein [Anaerolineae bacterium]|nr:glycosyltransferase family 39 protein [Anaerolineae bacterium]MDW8100335.1 glycosyltransferase family 39 protein [Anaerolineae bacterium]